MLFVCKGNANERKRQLVFKSKGEVQREALVGAALAYKIKEDAAPTTGRNKGKTPRRQVKKIEDTFAGNIAAQKDCIGLCQRLHTFSAKIDAIFFAPVFRRFHEDVKHFARPHNYLYAMRIQQGYFHPYLLLFCHKNITFAHERTGGFCRAQ